ncbi:MAG: Lrp/AsnC family transcriptional regulator [Betaproteobacteria bacterium]|nr:MAG: Lrp/AsnC family transcriptional regulator [Betaproteobacteria bacterium]TAG45964.1 MAG: Lrp/AsnC family transcriptional regulator [Betaproteobacteria bacterium]
MSETIDNTDLALLRALQSDARLTSAELGAKLSISQSPAWRRQKRLEQSGVIEGYRAVLSRKHLGLSVLAMVQIGMDRHDDASARAFEKAVSEVPQVVLCHGMSGPEDFLLLVVARDLDDFSNTLLGRLRSLPGVKSIRTSFSLKAIKDDVAILLNL